MSKKTMFFHVATILGLVMLISPVLLFANTIEPTIFGMPFLLAWVLFWWGYCTVVFLLAHFYNWGK